MTWSLNAHGFTGDVKAVEKFIGELAQLLAKPEYGTGGSQFSGLTGLRNNFHLDVIPPETAAGTPSGGQGDSTTPGEPAGGPSS